MTFPDYLISHRYTVEPEWQSTPRVGVSGRRVVDSRDSPVTPRYDAVALTAALRLNSKPALEGIARKVIATYATPYDILVRRVPRRADRS